MPRYIDADLLMRKINSKYIDRVTLDSYKYGYNSAILEVVLDIEDAPTADVVPVRYGRMIEDGNLYKFPLYGEEWDESKVGEGMGLKTKDEMLYVLQEITDSVHGLLDIIVVSGVYKELDDELRDRLGDSFDMICEAEEKLEELMGNDKP